MAELTKRIVSGVVLATVLLGDLWLGSWWYLVMLVAGGALVFREFVRLVLALTTAPGARTLWIVAGALYVGAACVGLWQVRAIPEHGLIYALWLFLIVWATDVGAYTFGRLIGGPRIAPRISPSKTWAGLLGGMVCAGGVSIAMGHWATAGLWPLAGVFFLFGAPLAVLAQTGDFFESWMKRRAGVKDSGGLIPGHGGLFDRVDGLLPVAIVFPWLIGMMR